jgi:hypothetical protein
MSELDLIRSYRGDVGSDDAARAAARAALRDHIAAPARKRRFRKPARRLLWPLAILLVGASAATAASLVLTSDDVSLGSVACLDTTRRLDSGGPGRSVYVEPSRDPVAQCARVWAGGHLGAGTPELVACVAAGQPVVVVPGGPGTCAELKLEPLPGDFAPAAAAMGKAKHVLGRDWDLNRPRSRCEDPVTALAHARGLLRDAGVTGVSVELAGSAPCAGAPSFSEGGMVVWLESLGREEAAARYELRPQS